VLDAGFAVVRVRDGYEPHGNAPYQITPELPSGSYFENLTGRSQREQGTAALFLPPRRLAGQHDLKFGIDLDHVGLQRKCRARAGQLSARRQDAPPREQLPRGRALLASQRRGRCVRSGPLAAARRPAHRARPALRLGRDYRPPAPVATHRRGLFASRQRSLDQVLRRHRPLLRAHTTEYLTRALAGLRDDTYYAADGVTPAGAPQQTAFIANDSSLHQARAINWSLGVEHKLPWRVFAGANFVQKRTSDLFTYANQSGPAALSGNYLLTNQRQDHYYSVEFDAKRLFANGYSLYASYTRSSARTNAALNYVPTLSLLGPQQSGPLAWDTPNRTISWGWLPVPLPKLKKSWDFVYLLDWRSGFPYNSVNANWQVVGAAGSQRFPDYVDFSPGLEWRFHFRGAYFGLRGVMENAIDRQNPAVVNNVVDSPQYGTFSEFLGRAFTARIRLIGAK
jgi:hypothetical protein